MSTTTWLLLQVWLTGAVAGVMWLLVAWIGKRWDRFALRRRSRGHNSMANVASRKAGASERLSGRAAKRPNGPVSAA
jgi:hypothetical protein